LFIFAAQLTFTRIWRCHYAQHPKLRGRKIDGLRDSLVKILSDFNLQKELLKGCTDILTTDVVGLLQKLNRQQKRAISLNPEETFCQQCQSSLTSIGAFLFLSKENLVGCKFPPSPAADVSPCPRLFNSCETERVVWHLPLQPRLLLHMS
jgi:hypothetical protein